MSYPFSTSILQDTLYSLTFLCFFLFRLSVTYLNNVQYPLLLPTTRLLLPLPTHPSSSSNHPTVHSPLHKNLLNRKEHTNRKICFFNARSIVNKSSFLENRILTHQYDLVFVVETWLNKTLQDALICPQGYNIIRRDRSDKRGGGILILHKSEYKVVEVRTYESQDFEYLCIDLLQPNYDSSIRFLCMYVPPDVTRDRNIIQNLCNCIELYKQKAKLFFLTGDFNMPFINWSSFNSSATSGELFLDYCIKNNLVQHIYEPTHVSGSMLDLILCDRVSGEKLNKIEVVPPLTSTCDHSMIEFSLYLKSINSICSSIPPTFNYERGNYDEINAQITSVDWNYVFHCNRYQVEEIYDYFLDLVHSLVSSYIPVRRFKPKMIQPSHIKSLAREKLKLYQKYKQFPQFKQDYKTISKKYDQEVLAWYESTEEKICNNWSKSGFYKYVNKKLKSFPVIPPLQTEKGNLLTDDEEKANAFNRQFQSVFVEDDGKSLNLSAKLDKEFFMKEVIFDHEIVYSALTDLSPKRSRTPDGVPAIFLKYVAHAITPFLTMLFNLSMQTGTLPRQWKTSVISPIYKKGSKNLPSNYRPISLTSVICRVFEKIISNHILNHLLINQLISNNQHGFLPRRSTITQLLDATNDWINSYTSNETLSVVYTDLAKAFDTVSHPKLLEILKTYGIDGKLLNWIESFLVGRKQQVSVGKNLSKFLEILSGVPQGSVIGPLFFLIFIDDITTTSTHSKICLFADDTKIYSTNPVYLQKDLDELDLFFKRRQLRLAVEKCQKITFSKKDLSYPLKIGDSLLDDYKTVKDLGVFVTSNLKWNYHIQTIVTNALTKSYQILRSFSSKNIWILRKAYLVYVRPLVEYGSVVWNPYLQKDIDLVERVQRYFTKKICLKCNIQFKSYEDRLYKLNLHSLQYRRLETDLIMVFKIINGLVDLPMNQFFLFYKSPYTTRRHKFCLAQNISKTEIQKGLFANRIVPVWNKLPNYMFTPNTLSSFTNKLKKLDLCNISNLKF